MDANQILGVTSSASLEDIRAAYLSKVREYPPERCPEEFERIRDAYEVLRDPRNRAKAMLIARDFERPLESLADEDRSQRSFAGPRPWREVLKSK
jgi:curved DNA-binding protein CbpA